MNTAPTTTGTPASPRSIAYLTDLAAARPIWADVENLHPDVIARLTQQQVSSKIREALQVRPERTTEPAPARATRTAPDVPAGHYAVPSRTGNNDLDFYRVDRPTDGRWAGYTFVKRVIGGHPDTNIRGAEQRDALERIAADPDAGPRYGRELGRCCACNRTLTDETSRALGIGPECGGRR